jgi:hypothetical protein
MKVWYMKDIYLLIIMISLYKSCVSVKFFQQMVVEMVFNNKIQFYCQIDLHS